MQRYRQLKQDKRQLFFSASIGCTGCWSGTDAISVWISAEGSLVVLRATPALIAEQRGLLTPLQACRHFDAQFASVLTFD